MAAITRQEHSPAGSPLVQWLHCSIVSAAAELVAAQRARPKLAESVAEILRESPVQEWEADRWMRGVKLRLIRPEAYFFRAGREKRGAVSLFVRNEEGMNVG